MSGPSVLVVDDDLFVRESLRRLLSASGVRVAGTCASGEEALEYLAVEERPDAILMDVRMDGMSGLTAARTIGARYPDTRVVILTSLDHLDTIGSAQHAGTWGFLVKDITPDALVAAVNAVVAGVRVASPGPHDRTRFSEDIVRRASQLSSRERDVLRPLCAGASNLEIARALFVSESTVKAHIQSLQNRLEAPNRIRLAIMAHDLGLDH